MEQTFHITDDGPKPCTAKEKRCPFKTFHGSFGDAEKAYADKNHKRLKGLSKRTSSRIPQTSQSALNTIFEDLNAQQIDLIRQRTFDLNELTPEQHWSVWRQVASHAKPSETLQRLHKLDFEKFYPELTNIRGVPQDPHWHPEGTVEKHVQESADIAASNARFHELNERDTQVAVLGALCHDFGKATHTQIDPDTGKITSQGHDKSGVEPSENFLKRIGAPEEVRRVIPKLVETHMGHTNKPTKKSVRKLMRKLDEVGGDFYDWIRICDADVNGRGSSPKNMMVNDWLEVYGEVQKEGELNS